MFFYASGAVLYRITANARLILEQSKTLELQEKNLQLTMQAMQYENLQKNTTVYADLNPGTECSTLQ